MRYGILCGVAAAALAGAWDVAAAQTAVGNESWETVVSDEEGRIQYDPASVERAGGMVRSRLRVIVNPERPGSMRSALVGVEINCPGQTLAFLSYEMFGEGGRPLPSPPPGPHDIEPIRSGSPEEILYRRLCPAALVRPIVPPPAPPMITVAPPPMRYPAPVAPPAPPPPPPPPPRTDPSGISVRARPLVPLASLVSADDYPAAALRAEAQGRVRVRLDISRQGRVTGCAVLESSGHSVLDAATCRIFTARARFAPARNRRGRTVKDTANAAVVWRIPIDLPTTPPEPPQPPEEQS